jgi:hypothetical protein
MLRVLAVRRGAGRGPGLSFETDVAVRRACLDQPGVH